jgi:hypothetical protein
MFDKDELPAIVIGVVVAALFLFGAVGAPPDGIYTEHRNYGDTLQRAEDTK